MFVRIFVEVLHAKCPGSRTSEFNLEIVNTCHSLAKSHGFPDWSDDFRNCYFDHFVKPSQLLESLSTLGLG